MMTTRIDAGSSTLARINANRRGGAWARQRWAAHALLAAVLSLLSLISAADLIFTSSPRTSATVGERYVYRMAATETEPEDRRGQGPSLRFMTSELPSWLQFDGDATIAGTPRAEDVGEHRVRLRVRQRSDFDEQTFSITVVPRPGSEQEEEDTAPPPPPPDEVPPPPDEVPPPPDEAPPPPDEAPPPPPDEASAAAGRGSAAAGRGSAAAGRGSAAAGRGSAAAGRGSEAPPPPDEAPPPPDEVPPPRDADDEPPPTDEDDAAPPPQVDVSAADLAASITVTPNPVLVEGTATWILQARNVGEVDVANLVLETVFSSDIAYGIDDGISDAACSLEPRGTDAAVICRWSLLSAGATHEAEITSRADEAGEIAAVATVSIADARPVDDNERNDRATVTLGVTEAPTIRPSQELSAPGVVDVVAGDFDGDGFDDLAVATADGEPTLIFLNVGDSEGGARRFVGTPLVAEDSGVAAALASADLDGDGLADIVVARADGASYVLFNRGSASFETVMLEGPADVARGVALGDVDGDGWLDIVFANEGMNTVHLNRGGRQFASAEEVSAGPSAAVAAVDLDGDGSAELIFLHPEGPSRVLRRGANGFEPEAVIDAGGAAAVAAVRAGGGARPSLFFGRRQAADVVVQNAGRGAPPFSVAQQLGRSSSVAVLTGDFDADGYDDVVAIGADGTHRLYKHDGTSEASFRLLPGRFVGKAASAAAVGMFDVGDYPDIAVAGSDVVAIFLDVGKNPADRDSRAPTLALNGAARMVLSVGDTYADAGATAFHERYGDLTDRIVVDNPVDTTVIGTYVVRYEVADDAGRMAVATRIVEVRARDAAGGGGGGAIGPILLLLILIFSLGQHAYPPVLPRRQK
jgi:hypothetical protein